MERDFNILSYGDASYDAAGAYIPTLHIWFELVWEEVLPPHLLGKHLPHINALEFVAVLVQFAAIVTFWQQASSEHLAQLFPDGVPPQPLIRSMCDNMVVEAWVKKGSATSSVLNLLKLYAVLTESFSTLFQLSTDRISSSDNVVADDISRPPKGLTHSQRYQRLCQKHPFLKHYKCFHPMLQALFSALSSSPSTAPVRLLANMGLLLPG